MNKVVRLGLAASVIAALLFALAVGQVAADKATQVDVNGLEVAWENSVCTKVQEGTLTRSDGAVIQTGYDEWGYNYQAHMFNGTYCDAYRDAAWCQPWAEDELIMKWNDAWLANVDCDGDDLLDRHHGSSSYKGSGAWLTNHMSGSYEVDGQTCSWTYFTKIVAAPADATSDAGFWYAADGTEIGPVIWGQFATIQTINNDSCGGLHGIEYNAPAPTGFGFYQP